jgi:hypothetical protein
MPGGVGGVASRDAPLSRLTAAIAVVAPSSVPSIALDSTGVKGPIDPSTTSRIYTSLADVTGGQHRGPITRAFIEVLEALLWGFHNSRTGGCFPSYETIAAKAECCRDTVYEALKVLELAGVLTWQHRIARNQVRERDLFGKWASRWRVIRTSNAYVFRDPASKS